MSKKIINISSSSIVDLKAELSRKEEQVRLRKFTTNDPIVDKNVNQNDNCIYSSYLERKTKLPKRILDSLQQGENETKNKKVKSSFVKDETDEKSELNENEERVLKQSRENLERKAELYSQMAKGLVSFDPDNENILVNFEEKSERFQYDDSDESNNDKIEYVDQFGRTRMLTKNELEEIESKKERIEKSNEFENENSNPEPYEPKSSTVLHYQDVREDEIREHGVAFYSFSRDEETRNKQMEALDKLRKETEMKKLQKQKIIDKRKLMFKSRLEKIALRKGIELPVESEEKEEDPSEMIRIEKATIMPELKRTTGIKEWDIGKEGVFSPRSFNQSPFYSQQKYQEKLRNERNPEFAPPQTYQTKDRNKFDRKKSTTPSNKDEYSFVMNKISELRRKS